MDEISRLVDTMVNIVSIRLGGILLYQADDDFLATPRCISDASPRE